MKQPQFVKNAQAEFLAMICGAEVHGEDFWQPHELDLIGLLVLTRGEQCTDADVEYAWAVAGNDPELLSASEVRDAVRAAAAGLPHPVTTRDSQGTDGAP